MHQIESLAEFYAWKKLQPSVALPGQGEHFNVYKAGQWVRSQLVPTPFNRKSFYKIKLILGESRCYFADKTIQIPESALLLAGPMIPYQIEWPGEQPSEYACIFTESFFHGFGPIRQYPVFTTGDHSVYLLTEAQVPAVIALFARMEAEMASDYPYKWDLLRNLVYELVHLAMKTNPAPVAAAPAAPANARIASLFGELLEMQFPLEAPGAAMQLRRPQDFARRLSLHVNHLNRALKATLGKTTSGCIGERILQEAKILLQHSDWNIAEIAFGLGFEGPAHFSSFFRKHLAQTPSQFRSSTPNY